jgi:chromosome segregation and condensation protein ScpB
MPTATRRSLPTDAPWTPDLLADAKARLTYRTLRVLDVVAAEAGLTNSAVSERAGITDQGQISKLLHRVAAQGLVENLGDSHAKGKPNAWRLTRKGRALVRALESGR